VNKSRGHVAEISAADSSVSLDLEAIARIPVDKLAALLSDMASSNPVLRRRLFAMGTNTYETAAGAQTKAQLVAVEDQAQSFEYMVGDSPPMRVLFEAIRRYGDSDAPVLITGESGTGKELAARAVHERSARNKGPFVAINCGALPITLIGSELFGYEKGAFTGATARKIGRIETANDGTIFLDEIADLPLEIQAHLLRFLQEKTIERIGGRTTISVNARVIAATNVNLFEMVGNGKFREDLFYRLNVLLLSIPPLRERRDDIMLLATFFLRTFARETNRDTLEFSPEAREKILAHSWPGNVRELIACIRRGAVMTNTSIIPAECLGISITKNEFLADKELGRAQAKLEVTVIRTALERNRYNIKRSAAEIGVSRVTLYRLIQKHNIPITRSSL